MILVKRKSKREKQANGKSEAFAPVTGRCRRNMLRIDVKQFKMERFIRESAKRARLKKIIEPKRGTKIKNFTSKIKNLLSPVKFFGRTK